MPLAPQNPPPLFPLLPPPPPNPLDSRGFGVEPSPVHGGPRCPAPMGRQVLQGTGSSGDADPPGPMGGRVLQGLGEPAGGGGRGMGFEEQGATHNRVEVVANQRLETPQRTSYHTNREQKGYKGDKAKTTRPREPLTLGSRVVPDPA